MRILGNTKPCQLRLTTITAVVATAMMFFNNANTVMSLTLSRTAARFALQMNPTLRLSSKRSSTSPRSFLSMDIERPLETNNHFSLPQRLSLSPVVSPSTGTTSSSHRPYFQRFWDMQHNVMQQRLTNLQAVPVVTKSGHDLSAIMDNRNCNRMMTQCYSSNEYKYIRMSLMDGEHTQVFTSVWYPRSSQLPILACDLLQFGKVSMSGQQRHLCIVDYQPVMVQGDELTDQEQVQILRAQQDELLQPIRDSFPLLQGEMSTRFYPQDAPYFSSHLLLGRHIVTSPMSSSVVASSSSTVSSELRSTSTTTTSTVTPPESGYESASDLVNDVNQAWQAYMGRHIDWTQQRLLVDRQESEADLTQQRRHTAYDVFSAKYDPALPMLGHLFGKELAHEYVHEILFPLSQS